MTKYGETMRVEFRGRDMSTVTDDFDAFAINVGNMIDTINNCLRKPNINVQAFLTKGTLIEHKETDLMAHSIEVEYVVDTEFAIVVESSFDNEDVEGICISTKNVLREMYDMYY